MALNPSQSFAHLTADNAARLDAILRIQIAEVFRLTRLIEGKTGYVSVIGRHNLNDALAHLSVLADPKLAPVDQASQLSKIEEHLRRVIVEHPEEVVRDRLGNIWELWQEYERLCYPYRESNVLNGAPRHEELEDLRNRIRIHMERARQAKPSESSWDKAIEAAAEATQGADLAFDLANKLNQCIGTAQKLGRDTRRFRIGAGIAVAGILIGLGGGYFISRQDTAATPPAPTVTLTSPSTSPPAKPNQRPSGRPAPRKP